MKIVLTGATGFVGGEVLAQLLADPKIAHITCLTRRAPKVEAAEAEASKLEIILLDDFTRIDAPLAEKLGVSDACIWALGGKAAEIGAPDVLRRVTYDFTLALAAALAPRVHRRFVFCYLSGMGADQTERAWFPWEKQTRHLKGRTERDLLALSEEHRCFEAHFFRPAGILPRGANRIAHALLSPIVVGVDELACSLIRVATDGGFDRGARVIGNREIKRIAHSRAA